MSKNKIRQKSNPLPGLMPGIRMKGGVRYDPSARGFVVIVHTWDNALCKGDPSEWRAPQAFLTEAAALQYYKTNIRPKLAEIMSRAETSGVQVFQRKLEE